MKKPHAIFAPIVALVLQKRQVAPNAAY